MAKSRYVINVQGILVLAAMARVAATTSIGSVIEAFDFLAYGTAAAPVFNKLFVPTVPPPVGILAAFGALALSLFAREQRHIYWASGERMGC